MGARDALEIRPRRPSADDINPARTRNGLGRGANRGQEVTGQPAAGDRRATSGELRPTAAAKPRGRFAWCVLPPAGDVPTFAGKLSSNSRPTLPLSTLTALNYARPTASS
jgi:hypothetical protein